MRQLIFLITVAFFSVSCESIPSSESGTTGNPPPDSPKLVENEWEQQEVGTNEDFIDVFFIDAQNGWIVGDKHLLHTTDGGKTWERRENPGFNSVYFTDTQNGWAVGGHMIQHTSNGGETWHNQAEAILDSVIEDSEENLYSVYFTDNQNGWVVGSDISMHASTILHTSDGGKTWEVQYDHDIDEAEAGETAKGLRDIHFVDEQTGWAVGSARELNGPGGSEEPLRSFILKTNDGGKTWTSTISEPGYGNLREIFFVDSQHGWIIDKVPFIEENFTEQPISITRDGGQTWSGQPLGEATDIHFVSPDTGWAVGYTVRMTTDGGRTWIKQDSVEFEQRLKAVSFAGKNNGWAVGRNGTILHFCNHH